MLQTDIDLTFDTLTKVQNVCKFPFSGEGWYYKAGDDGVIGTLLITRVIDKGWRVRVWNTSDPRPELKRLLELQTHTVP